MPTSPATAGSRPASDGASSGGVPYPPRHVMECHVLSCAPVSAPAVRKALHPPFGPWSRTPSFTRVRPHNARPPAPARIAAGPFSPPWMSWNVMFLSRRRAAGPSAGGRDSGLMLRAFGLSPLPPGGRGRGWASRRDGRLPGFARRFRWRGSGPPPGLPRKRERGLPAPGGTGSNRRPPPAKCPCGMADIRGPLRNVMECHDRHVPGA